MGLRVAMLFLAGVLSAVLAAGGAGCAGGGAGGVGGDASGRFFLRELEARSLTLPLRVSLSDFNSAARGSGVTDPEGFLESMGILVRGSGSDRWLSRADLLRACGAGCDRREGLGELLVKFAVVHHRD